MSKPRVTVLELQQLAGRCVSFMLVVPAAELYTREINAAISSGLTSNSSVAMSGALQDEVAFWKFLDTWSGQLTWKKERHISLTLHTDASLYKWSGVVHLPGNNFSISDYWCAADQWLPIMVLEARALI